jgi:hypothetical protein
VGAGSRFRFRPSKLPSGGPYAVPGEEMVLSTGAHWREYYVKGRPSGRGGHRSVLFGSGMQQTDLLCILESAILDE